MVLLRRLIVLAVVLELASCSGNSANSESQDPESSSEQASSYSNSSSAEPKLPFVGGSIMFTEVDPINTVYEDHEGGDAGWVELFNASSDSVNLNGLALTNSLAEPTKWIFGNVVVPPQSFMVVYLSGKNLPDYEAPHDSVSMIGTGCWTWTDAQNEDVAGTSYSEPLSGKSKLCFSENGIRMFGSRMKLGENAELGWSSISSFVGTRSSASTDVIDISGDNELLMRAYITKDRKVSFRLGQSDVDEWKGYEIVLTGTGDSSTVYRVALPTGKTFPDLANIYGTRMSPEANEKKEVTVKVFSYIARNRGHEAHTSFKIKNESGTLYLVNPSVGIMDSVAYSEVPVGKTWSLGEDSAKLALGNASLSWGFSDPTPYGMTTSSVVADRSPSLDTLTELPPSGFYQAAFAVTFPEEDYVRCEVGGKAPSKDSPLVTALGIDTTRVIRCASFIPGQLEGPVLNRTYVFETQPSIPAVFITTDANSLFDPDTGIYMEGNDAEEKEPHYGANYWEDKEIPVFVELLESGVNSPAFALDAGLKIFGNYSRANDKKSVSITFREEYGEKRLNYMLFPEFPELTKFKHFVLRDNGSNAYNDYIRDRLASSISEGLGVDYQRGRPAIVYYDGEYYGIHDIREKSTEYYFETHYGYDPDNIDLLMADNSVSAGSSTDYTALMEWLENWDLSVDENYAYVAERIDVENFMNYMQTEIFVNNRDWPANNLKKWRVENPASKWKWFFYDMDFGFGTTMSAYTNNIFDYVTAEDGESYPNGPEHTLLIRKLLENESFRNAFINRMTTLLSMNFESSRVLARIDAMMAEIESEIPRDQKRWGRSESWMSSQLKTIKTFADNRPAVILSELAEHFNLATNVAVTLSVQGKGKIQVNGLPLDVTPMTIQFFTGLPVTLTAVPDAGSVWVGWNDGAMDTERTIYPENTPSLTANFR